jgi:V/A-type H+-transporting ATPase subunit K
MDAGVFGQIGVGAALGISAVGSAIGAGIAGQAAIGAWKKCFVQNKPAPFILVAFAGAPLTQTIYGFILMSVSLAPAVIAGSLAGWQLFGLGLFAGCGMGASAIVQGMCSAAACDAYGETGKGFGNYMLVIGLCETVALFTMVFSMLVA